MTSTRMIDLLKLVPMLFAAALVVGCAGTEDEVAVPADDAIGVDSSAEFDAAGDSLDTAGDEFGAAAESTGDAIEAGAEGTAEAAAGAAETAGDEIEAAGDEAAAEVTDEPATP